MIYVTHFKSDTRQDEYDSFYTAYEGCIITDKPIEDKDLSELNEHLKQYAKEIDFEFNYEFASWEDLDEGIMRFLENKGFKIIHYDSSWLEYTSAGLVRRQGF